MAMCYVQGVVIRLVWPKCSVTRVKLARAEIKIYPEGNGNYISHHSLLASKRNRFYVKPKYTHGGVH